MGNTNGTRWKQRLESFGKILSQLETLCELDSYTDIELLALMKAFELSQEMGWQTLKDLLSHEGHDLSSPHPVVDQALQSKHISKDDATTFHDAIGKRNRLSHVYDEESAREAETLIKQKYYPMLRRIHASLTTKAEQ